MKDLPGVTLSEVKGFGKSQAADAPEKFVEAAVEFAKMVRIEIVVPNDGSVTVKNVIRQH